MIGTLNKCFIATLTVNVMVNNAFTGQHSQPQTEDKGREEDEDKKKLAQELIIGWTHTKVRSQEVEEDKKRLAQELIIGWTHTKVREVRR